MARQRRIRLGGKKILYVTVDARDYRWLRAKKWSVHTRGYAQTSAWNGIGTSTWFMHRLIVERMRGGRKIPRNLVVDHKNRNRRDNRRSNLRLVKVATNNRNRWNVLLWDGERWVYEPHGRLG